MKLYYSPTPNPRKACAVAKHLGSPVDYVAIDLVKGEHKTPDMIALNPNAKVPVLTDGDTVIWESNAIMCYLADKAGSDLWPKDERQIDVIRWLSWNGSHFGRHAGALFFQNFVKKMFGWGDPDQAAVEEATELFKQFAAVLDGHLKGRDFLVGEGLTVADFAVAGLLPWAEQSNFPLDGFAELNRWNAGLLEIPAWRDPWPE